MNALCRTFVISILVTCNLRFRNFPLTILIRSCGRTLPTYITNSMLFIAAFIVYVLFHSRHTCLIITYKIPNKIKFAKVPDFYIELIIWKRCIRHLYRNLRALFFRKLPTYDKQWNSWWLLSFQRFATMQLSFINLRNKVTRLVTEEKGS